MEGLPCRVRTMELGDVDAVLHIDQLSFPLSWPASVYRYEIMRNPNAHYYVAEMATPARDEDEIPQELGFTGRLRRMLSGGASRHRMVGFGGFWLAKEEAHISTLAVHPDYRGRGLGELLLLHMLKEAREHQAEVVILEVRVSNAIAQKLYAKCGFQTIGRRRQYYIDNREDALVMKLAGLAGPEFVEGLPRLEEALHKKLKSTAGRLASELKP